MPTSTSDWNLRAATPERVKSAVPLPCSLLFTRAMASSRLSTCARGLQRLGLTQTSVQGLVRARRGLARLQTPGHMRAYPDIQHGHSFRSKDVEGLTRFGLSQSGETIRVCLPLPPRKKVSLLPCNAQQTNNTPEISLGTERYARCPSNGGSAVLGCHAPGSKGPYNPHPPNRVRC